MPSPSVGERRPLALFSVLLVSTVRSKWLLLWQTVCTYLSAFCRDSYSYFVSLKAARNLQQAAVAPYSLLFYALETRVDEFCCRVRSAHEPLRVKQTSSTLVLPHIFTVTFRLHEGHSSFATSYVRGAPSRTASATQAQCSSSSVASSSSTTTISTISISIPVRVVGCQAADLATRPSHPPAPSAVLAGLAPAAAGERRRSNVDGGRASPSA